MSEQSIVLSSDRPVLQTWGLKITGAEGDEPTNAQYVEMFDAIKSRLEDAAESGYRSVEINEFAEDENFTGWAYVINENDSPENYAFSLTVQAVIEKDFDVNINFSLAPMSSENYDVDLEDLLECAELDEEKVDEIQSCLDAQVHSGNGEIFIDDVQLNYHWEIEKN